MKNVFLSAWSILISLSAFCQDIIVEVMNFDSLGCQKVLIFQVINNSTSTDSGMLSIDWGDGSAIEQQSYSVTQSGTNNSVQYINKTHPYALGGNYTIDVQALSNFPGVAISIPNGNQVISAFGSNSCGYANFGVLINGSSTCSPNIFNNVQLDFTDNANSTTTVSGFWSTFSGLNPNNAPYTVSINDAWLLANNLTQTSADLAITGFLQNGEAITSNHLFTVAWTAANTIADPSFNYGSAWNFVAPLQTGTLTTSFNNLTCVPMNSNLTVTITMPALFIPNTTGLLNPTVSGNVLTFEVLPFIGYDGVSIPFTFPGTLTAGTGFCFDVEIDYTGDFNILNNEGQICGVVLNSYDPNMKSVNFAQRLDPDTKEKLVYKVQFQNDGNYSAVNVKITDLIDANLNLSTLRVLESSHPQATKVNATSRQVDFIFSNVMLESSTIDLASSQGYVVYEIEENANLAVGSTIENTANIYFDFNPPITTNTTLNINEYLLGIDDLTKSTLQFYPNPAKENITFKGEVVEEVSVYDLSGKIVLSVDNLVNNTLSVSNLNNGFYMVIVKTITGNSTAKMSIQH